MDDLKGLADAVRAARKRKLWGQQELANAAGVSLGVVSNLERLKTRPQPANERAILEVLELDVSEDIEAEVAKQENRGEWPDDVEVFVDVMRLVLSAIPESRRPDIISDLTRRALDHLPRP